MTADSKVDVEHVTRLYFSHNGGEYMEICDDRDGLGLTQIRWIGVDGKEAQSVAFPPEGIEPIIAALRSRLPVGAM